METKIRSAIVRVDTEQLATALTAYARITPSIDLNTGGHSSPVEVIIDGAVFAGHIDVAVKDRTNQAFTVMLEVIGAATSNRWFVELNRSKNGDTWHAKQKLFVVDESHELYVHAWTDQ